MTTNKTTALIEAFRAEVNSIPMGQECVQKGASAYNWGKYYLARLETLAAFEQPSVKDGELLPCPFCGCEASYRDKPYKEVECLCCDCNICDESYELVVKRWNTRAAFEQPAVRKMTVDEVEEYIYSETKRFTETSVLIALAKLGTIRVVEGK